VVFVGINKEENEMRVIFAAVIVAAGIGFMSANPASAAPANGSAVAGTSQRTDVVVHVAQGCGRWHHRNHWGHCVHD
jgi:hypothetical protein